MYISIQALSGQDLCKWAVVFWKKSFFWAVGHNSWIQIFSKPCCRQRYCHPGFIVAFTEHRQSRFSKIFKGYGIFRMENEHWLQVTICVSPWQKVSQSLQLWSQVLTSPIYLWKTCMISSFNQRLFGLHWKSVV